MCSVYLSAIALRVSNSVPLSVVFFYSGLSCGIYATNNAEACKYIAGDCKVAVAVVEDQKQLDKFLKVHLYFVLAFSN